MTYGMYGGKFMPMHKGHLHCVEKALEECDKLFLILCVNGEGEQRIWDRCDFCDIAFPPSKLTQPTRIEQINRVADMYKGRVIPIVADLKTCRKPDGTEDWDAETPIIINACSAVNGREHPFDIVYGSEPEYADYFNRAYPWAEYHMVDVDRNEVPISATKIRNMPYDMAKEWLV